MTVAGDPFRQAPVDPSNSLDGRPSAPYLQPVAVWPFVHDVENPYPPTKQPHNTLAVLSPILAVVVPPAGAILGHLALAQIRRSGEQGRTAAIWGLILGYLLTLALVAGLIVWAVSNPSGTAESMPPQATFTVAPLPQDSPPVVVTSVAPPPSRPRVKLDLATVTVGTCAEIQKRDVGDDALDLFGVPCEHRQGVYTVVARVATDSNCQSTYVAAPPDHSFALCLNEY
jgi:hypothetical protein